MVIRIKEVKTQGPSIAESNFMKSFIFPQVNQSNQILIQFKTIDSGNWISFPITHHWYQLPSLDHSGWRLRQKSVYSSIFLESFINKRIHPTFHVEIWFYVNYLLEEWSFLSAEHIRRPHGENPNNKSNLIYIFASRNDVFIALLWIGINTQTHKPAQNKYVINLLLCILWFTVIFCILNIHYSANP